MRHIVRWSSALFVLAALTACGARANAPDAAPSDRLRVQIKEEGLYQITRSELKPFGWDLSAASTEAITLEQGDARIPAWIDGQGDDTALVFYGTVTPTRYSDEASYILDRSGEPTALATRGVAPADAPPIEQVVATLRHEENSVYAPQVREGDPWLGPRIFAPGEASAQFDLDHPASGPATLNVRVWGGSEGATDPDHHVVYLVNGVAVGEDRWDGKGFHETRIELAAEQLKPGANTLTLSVPGDTAAPAEIVHLDAIEITYPRQLTTDNDQLAFEGQAGTYRLSGFRDTAIELWDVTDPAQPARLTDFAVQSGADGASLTFTDTGEGQRRYLATTRLAAPAIAAAPAPLTAPAAGADYIVITHPSLLDAVQPLVAWRAGQGLRTAVVTTEQIYDRFSAGAPDPTALRAFLRWADETWPAPAPRFVLLAGDASYDPLAHLGGPYRDLVPTSQQSTQVMGETASDNWLADVDDDGLPELAVGRLPAQTPAQMQAMIDKTLGYEQRAPAGDWRRQSLFIADDDDTYFRNFNEDIVAGLPDDIAARQIVIDPATDVRADLLDSLNQGIDLISYMGHGAVDLWAQEEILTAGDVQKLSQQTKLPFIVVWACLSGYFHHPQVESLGETLLLTPGKGAVAALVPTGQTYPDHQHVMAEALFDEHLFASPTVGEAILASLQALDPANPGERDIINTFVLLGDPALRLAALNPEG